MATPSSSSQQRTLRAKVVEEVVATERTFVASLKLVIDLYIKPLHEQAILSREESSGLFSNWEMLFPLNNAFLEALQKATEKGTSNCRIGAPFKDFAPYFRMFATYLGSYEKAMTLKGEICERNRKFVTLLDETRKDPRCQGLDLMSYLIMPVQRIPRYKLLLESLLKHTEPSDHDYKDLQDALTLVSAAASHNNAAIKKQQEALKMMEIQRLFDPHGGVPVPNLMDSPIRRFMKEGVLHVKRSKDGKIKKLNVWLFNDLILLGKPPDILSLSVEKFFLKAFWELDDCTVDRYGEGLGLSGPGGVGGGGPEGVGMADRDRMMVLCKPSCEPWYLWAKDGAEMEAWLNEVTVAIEEAKKMVGRKAAAKITPVVSPCQSFSSSSSNPTAGNSSNTKSLFMRPFNTSAPSQPSPSGDQPRQQAAPPPPPPPLPPPPPPEAVSEVTISKTPSMPVTVTAISCLPVASPQSPPTPAQPLPKKDTLAEPEERERAPTSTCTSSNGGPGGLSVTSLFGMGRRQSISTKNGTPCEEDASRAIIHKMNQLVTGHEQEIAERMALVSRLRRLSLLRMVIGTDSRGKRIDETLQHLEQEELTIQKYKEQQAATPTVGSTEAEQLCESLHLALKRDGLALECMVELLILLVTHGVTADRRNAREILELRAIIADLATLKAKATSFTGLDPDPPEPSVAPTPAPPATLQPKPLTSRSSFTFKAGTGDAASRLSRSSTNQPTQPPTQAQRGRQDSETQQPSTSSGGPVKVSRFGSFGRPKSEGGGFKSVGADVRRTLTRRNSNGSSASGGVALKASTSQPGRSVSASRAMRNGGQASATALTAATLQSRIDRLSTKVIEMFSAARAETGAPPPTTNALPKFEQGHQEPPFGRDRLRCRQISLCRPPLFLHSLCRPPLFLHHHGRWAELEGGNHYGHDGGWGPWQHQ